ncbi:acetate kinase [Fulvivirga sp. M361]|uniref:acetate/propionate family kinase n=1 Tax=Fulvivirga sp. M361 TaxID=2594266 RepID=UPI00117A8C94|nr:acetate kinase [Fulvivirga sp. M361]TRX60603.1 acetate kinase [Fulvivirga sp. M361]
MKVLVLNAGSSSLKYQLFQLPEKQVLASGSVERIGESKSGIKHKVYQSGSASGKITLEVEIPDHKVGLEKIARLLLHGNTSVIKDQEEIEVVGHRVVHGAEKFSRPTLVDAGVLDELRKLSYLAPLHNPANITGIEVSMQVFKKAQQVAVFDTAFHQTLPSHVYRYAVPNELYTKHGFRAYGFHGTSHRYVSREAASFLGIDNDSFNAISIHLGNGCSMTAVKEGKSIDTSMGLTPMGGLMMGTRPGDFDPSLILFLGHALKMNFDEVDKLLNKNSGLKGITGENDLREVIKQYEENDPQAQLAIHMYIYRIRKYIGAYAVALGRVDAVIFTAGVGENSPFIRKEVCTELDILGIQLDEALNSAPSEETREIQHEDSRVKLLVVPTNEELEIVNEVVELTTPGE